MKSERKTVGELRAFLADFDDDAQIGVMLWPYGGMVTGWYGMRDFEDEGIENPSVDPYPVLTVGPT